MRQKIQTWIGDLSHREPRRRRAAQTHLERLPKDLHLVAGEMLVEKPDLEYALRRRRIIATYFNGRSLEDRITQQIIAYRKTGKCDVPGFVAFARIVGDKPGHVERYIALQQDSRDFLLTVYAAPHYADASVTRRLQLVGDQHRRIAQVRNFSKTSNIAMEMASVFLVLCDNNVSVNEKRITRGLEVLQNSALTIAMATNDPEFGEVFETLLRRFVEDAGERDDDFLLEARRRFAKALTPFIKLQTK